MVIRVAATILEKVDYPEDALAACGLCLEELHSMPAVQRIFSVELEKRFMARFSKDERRKIISTVCQLNRVIYDVTQTVGKDVHFWIWPFVDTGEGKVDPLRDSRVTEVLRKQGMDHCCVTPWSFGQEGEEEHKLKDPRGIATNTKGQFIVADFRDRNAKVFDSSGKFLYGFRPQTDEVNTWLDICDVATDRNDNIYVLVNLKKPGTDPYASIMYVCVNTADGLNHKFAVKRGAWYVSMAVNDNGTLLVLVGLGGPVDMYKTDGQFVHRFEKGIWKNASSVTCDNNGRVMLLDRNDFLCFTCTCIVSRATILTSLEWKPLLTIPGFHFTN